MQTKAVLFDMDGVLIDAREWHYVALNKALSLFGYSISIDSHLTTYDGLPTRVKLEKLSRAYNLPVGLHDLISNLKQQHTLELAYQHCKPTFNHRDCLSRLADLNISVAVCSNSIRHTITTFLSLAGLDRSVSTVISNEDVTLPKPSPEMYLLAMEKLGLTPDECLIVEDNDHGYEAGVRSGARVLRVSGPADVTFSLIYDHLS